MKEQIPSASILDEVGSGTIPKLKLAPAVVSLTSFVVRLVSMSLKVLAV